MSMLAEPRRKQKYSVNPRGLDWANDDSKIGQKLMEKMGWSKGKGLGAKEDGNRDHITVSAKNDHKGVGCTQQHADNWLAHQDDFAAILAKLNETHNTTEKQSVDSNVREPVCSLEEKSKNSKKRVHYQKFTRGKDLSLYKAEDLKCIFGGRNEKETTQSAAGETVENTVAESSGSGSALKNQSEMNNELAETENSFGVKTITSSSNINDYFAKMMALRRANSSSSLIADSALSVAQLPTIETTVAADNDRSSSSDEGISFSVETSKKRKRKRDRTDIELNEKSKTVKRCKKDEENLAEETLSPVKVEESNEETERKKSRELKREMKRARKLNKSENLESADCSVVIIDKDEVSQNALECPAESADPTVADEGVCTSEKKKKKRRSKDKKLDDVKFAEKTDVTVLEKIKDNDEVQGLNTFPVAETDLCVVEKNKKKKNRKTSRASDSLDVPDCPNNRVSKSSECVISKTATDTIISRSSKDVIICVDDDVQEITDLEINDTKDKKKKRRKNKVSVEAKIDADKLNGEKKSKKGGEDTDDVMEIICVDDENSESPKVERKKKNKKNKK